ncbi:MAG TPA: hypothetical protein VF843_01800 [Streptosporangiaceae bacterium]
MAALAGTVIGVAVAGMPSGRGATTGTAASGQPGAGQAGAGQAGADRQVGRGQASQGQAGQGHAGQGNGQANSGQASQGQTGQGHAGQSQAGQSQAGQGQGQAGGHQGSSGTAATGQLRTSCRNVAHIGDSTSVDLISAAMVPQASQRLAARYRDVGVSHVRIDASGGRSIVEELPGQQNGFTVASDWRAQGYRGCWVFALGTNDAANVAAGSTVGLTARIDRMMAVAHGQPVLWVNTRTELTSGAWAEANEKAWDAALTSALARYPNLRIFNWSAVARPAWFLSDGIHYNSAGCAARAKAIADALARAFPLHGRSKGRVVL